jgi:hypothetical protein
VISSDLSSDYFAEIKGRKNTTVSQETDVEIRGILDQQLKHRR